MEKVEKSDYWNRLELYVILGIGKNPWVINYIGCGGYQAGIGINLRPLRYFEIYLRQGNPLCGNSI